MTAEADKRTLRAEQTKNQIIDAAEQLFQKNGFAATSMSEVAKEAGVTKSLIHHHFGSKESLWDAVCRRNSVRMKNYLGSLLSERMDFDTDEEFIKRAIVDYFHHIEDNPGFSRLQAWVAAEQRSQRSMQLETFKALESKITDSQEKGELRSDLDPRFIIFVYWSMVEHWYSNKHIYAKRFGESLPENSGEKYLETALSIFLEGIRPDKK